MRRRPELESALSETSGEAFALGNAQDIGGGSISRAFRLDGSSRSVFAKIDGPDRLSLFRAEARGLDELRRAPGVRVPGTVLVGGRVAYANGDLKVEKGAGRFLRRTVT